MLFEYELLKRELDTFEQGLVTYENCRIISDYYQKYGYTEHLRVLIGDEGLITTIIEAGSKFIEWLKKKLDNIIQAIKRFLLKILNKVLVFFGFKPIESDNQAQMHASWVKVSKEFQGCTVLDGNDRMSIPYRVNDIHDHFQQNSVVRILNSRSPVIGDDYSINVYHDKVRIAVDAMISVLQKRSDGAGSSGTRHGFKKVLVDIFRAIDVYIIKINEWSDQLTEVKHKISEEMDDNTIRSLICELNVNYHMQNNVPTETLVRDVMRLAAICISSHSTVVQHAIPVLLDIVDLFAIGKNNVHIEEPIDGDFKRRLEGLFGREFKLDKMIITNKDPRSWILNTDKETSRGWCVVGENVTGVRTIYINYNYILHYIKQTHGQLTVVAKHVLKTMVHESRHVFDGQTGRKFDDFTIEWENRQQEQRSIRASNIFIITDHDIRWIEDVLRRIKTDYTK